MKSVGELMAELGFREDGSDDVKKAFIMNLIRSAAQADALRGKPIAETPFSEKKAKPPEPEQLSFNLGPVSDEAIHSLEALKRLRGRSRRKSG
ncbi:MAG: hypothetical protein V4692_13675 [Bdellovibrionota bacterium]